MDSFLASFESNRIQVKIKNFKQILFVAYILPFAISLNVFKYELNGKI